VTYWNPYCLKHIGDFQNIFPQKSGNFGAFFSTQKILSSKSVATFGAFLPQKILSV
jgi:hypothetical protein